MNLRIEQKEAFEVMGVQQVFKNDESGKVSGFWDKKIKDGSLDRLRKQSGQDSLMGICGHIDKKTDEFWYMIGAFVKNGVSTDGFTVKKASAVTWAIFRSEEFDEEQYGKQLPGLYGSAYKEWLPSSGYEKIDGGDDVIYDMEIYGKTAEGKFFEEVWLSVSK